jgi:hypothetical protein
VYAIAKPPLPASEVMRGCRLLSIVAIVGRPRELAAQSSEIWSGA